MYTVLNVQDLIEGIRNKVDVWFCDCNVMPCDKGIPLSIHVTENSVKVNIKTRNGCREYSIDLIGLSEMHAKVLYLSKTISNLSEEIKSLSSRKKELSLQLIEIYASETEGE